MYGKLRGRQVKRRRVKMNYRRIVLLLAICCGLKLLGSQVWDDSWLLKPARVQAQIKNAGAPAGESEYMVVQVQAGDSLWRLAKAYGPHHWDPRKVVEHIRRLNGLDGVAIWPGQLLAIPRY